MVAGWDSPEDVSKTPSAFLAAPESGFITAQIVTVTGRMDYNRTSLIGIVSDPLMPY